VLQCVAVCCSACGRYSQISARSVLQCVAVCCSVLQCVAVCVVDILKYYRCALIMCWDAGRRRAGEYSQMLAHSVLQCVAVCCSVLQCVAVCYSVLQCLW